MDAVVIVDPVQYQRRGDGRDDVSMPLRSLHFGSDGGGPRSWCTRLMISCSLSRSSGSAVNNVWLSQGGLMPPGVGTPAWAASGFRVFRQVPVKDVAVAGANAEYRRARYESERR
jgi:hypothetical protein